MKLILLLLILTLLLPTLSQAREPGEKPDDGNWLIDLLYWMRAPGCCFPHFWEWWGDDTDTAGGGGGGGAG